MCCIANDTLKFSCEGGLSRLSTEPPGNVLQALLDRLRRAAAGLRGIAPYAAIELLLPGGSLIALGLWLLRQKNKRSLLQPIARI